MKPIPAPHGSMSPKPGEAIASPAPGTYIAANRRNSTSNVHRAYPWLLAVSTAVAAVFFALYVTKPVFDGQKPATESGADQAPAVTTNDETTGQGNRLLPDTDRLPGDTAAGTEPPPSSADTGLATGKPAVIAPVRSIYEETNLRVQHILTAESPDGHLNRIDIEVPVLYQSRNLGWSEQEVATARDLMLRLMDYQDKTRQLRDEGQQLLVAWNELVGQSIPSDLLRADSPSLPENQEDATKTMRPVDKTTEQSIQIETNP